MILSLLVIAISLGVGYVWLNRGLFSALLNLLCVLVAGAIAFGLWETFSNLLIESAPREGFFGFVGSSAWAAGLLVPFAVSLALLRTIVDSLVRANAKLAPPIDMAGGAVLGLASGVIVSGFVVLGLSYARLPASVFGHEPVEIEQGSVVERGSLLLPADTLVAGLYSHLSRGAFRTADPLSYWRPNVASAGWRSRLNHGNGASMNIIREDEFSIAARYTVGKEQNLSVQQLVGPDEWYTSTQPVTGLDGEPVTGSRYIEGFRVDFEAGAREDFGQVVISAPQVTLLYEDTDGNTGELHPVAVVSIADAAQAQFARFRFMSRDAVAYEGQSDASMAFEFLVPSNASPRALYVKGTRVDVAETPVDSVFATPANRNASIRTGALMGGENVIDDLFLDDAVYVDSNQVVGFGGNDVTISHRLPGRRVLQAGSQTSGLQLNDDNEVVSGTTILAAGSLSRSGSITAELRVTSFAIPEASNIVQVSVAANSAVSFANEVDAIAALSPAERRDAPPVLLGTGGESFSCFGYIYEDDNQLVLRYAPGDPIKSLEELRRAGVEVSRNAGDQTLTLLFLVTEGARIDKLAIGNRVTAIFENAPEPGFEVPAPRRR